MTKTIDAMKLNVKDVETVLRVEGLDLEIGSIKLLKEVISSIRAAIASEEAKPVEPIMYTIQFESGSFASYAYRSKAKTERISANSHQPNTVVPLYTHPAQPPQDERVPMTDDEIDRIPFKDGQDYIETVGATEALRQFARAIEAHHGITGAKPCGRARAMSSLSPQARELSDEGIMDLSRAECENFRWPSSAINIARAVLAARGCEVSPEGLFSAPTRARHDSQIESLS